MSKRIVAIVGSYRRGGTIERLVDHVLESAAEHGVSTNKIFLLDRQIEFCTNCRQCTQQGGKDRGRCELADEMAGILDEIEGADGLILASPINFGTVTAVMKRFIERTICLGYWPWGKCAPVQRNRRRDKEAVVICSSAAPGVLGRVAGHGIGVMKKAVALLGGKSVGTLMVGLVALERRQELPSRAVRKARRLGQKLAAG